MYGTDGGRLSQQSSASRRFGKDIKRGEKKEKHEQNTQSIQQEALGLSQKTKDSEWKQAPPVPIQGSEAELKVLKRNGIRKKN